LVCRVDGKGAFEVLGRLILSLELDLEQPEVVERNQMERVNFQRGQVVMTHAFYQ